MANPWHALPPLASDASHALSLVHFESSTFHPLAHWNHLSLCELSYNLLPQIRQNIASLA